jgi:predicted O-methyltransferase YrrM
MGQAPAPTEPSATPATPEHYAGARVPRPPLPAHRYRIPREHFRFFPKLLDDSLHPKAWVFPEHLNTQIPWVATLRDLYASPVTFPASISPEAGLLLHSLVRNIRPRTIVEVGSFLGVSTIWMAAALESAAADPGQAPTRDGQPQGMIHAFDDFGPMARGPWRETDIPTSRLPLIKESLERARLSHRVTLHPGDSGPTIREFRDQLRGPESPWESKPYTGGVDFALIDGDHTTPGAIEDLWAIEPVLNTGGYIVLHDTFPEQCGDHEGPRHIIDHIQGVAQGTYELCELYTAPLNYGMALLRRIG